MRAAAAPADGRGATATGMPMAHARRRSTGHRTRHAAVAPSKIGVLPSLWIYTMNRCQFLRCATLSALALAVALPAQAQSAAAEPEIASYSIDTTLKLSSDRKSRGVSDSFGQPGLELTVEAAHESGLVAQFQLGTVSAVSFPESNRLNPLLGVGWRGGNPDGLHYGVGAARE